MVVGDKVKVIKHKYGHEFEIGQIVTIKVIDQRDGGYECVGETNPMMWWLWPEEFEPLNQEQ